MTPQIKRLREWCEFQKADLATHKWKDVFWEECMQRVSDVEFLIGAVELAEKEFKNIDFHYHSEIGGEIARKWLSKYSEDEDGKT